MSEETKQETTTAVEKSAGTKVAVKENTIKSILNSEGFKSAIASIIPKHITAERMARTGIMALTKTPKLATCTKESFINCMMTLSQLGLEPDGRRAHLIPYENRNAGTCECTLIVDYKGFVDLVYRSGSVSNIHADIVCENDTFEYDMGEIKTHKIDFKKPRGSMYAVYCRVTMKDGTSKCEVMSKDDVDAIRKRSRAGSSGPWVSDYNEMAKKTVFKRCFKWLPIATEIKDAIEEDDKFDGITINTKRLEKGSASDCFAVEDESVNDCDKQA